MKKRLLLLIVLIIPFYVFSQDLIVRKNGTVFNCKITKEDSLSVYFTILKDGNHIDSYLNKSDIISYKYNHYTQNQNDVLNQIKELASDQKKAEEQSKRLEKKKASDQREASDQENVVSQDLIICKNGKVIDCKITKVDSLAVYFNLIGDDNIKSYINRSDIKGFEYNYKQYKDQYKSSATTIGILEGGGSLIGADIETLLSKQIGFQVGIGLVGFGCGVDLHFAPSIRSPFFSIQYWHQGIGNSYAQSLIGPSFVFRNSKWLSWQIGVGFPVGKGPAYPADKQQPAIMLTYALGFYIPY